MITIGRELLSREGGADPRLSLTLGDAARTEMWPPPRLQPTTSWRAHPPLSLCSILSPHQSRVRAPPSGSLKAMYTHTTLAHAYMKYIMHTYMHRGIASR